MFLREYPRLRNDLRGSVQRQDPEALERSAHVLMGAAGHFFADRVVEALFNLAQAGRQDEITRAADDLAELEAASERLQTTLEELAKEMA